VFTPRYLGDGLHTVRNILVTNNIIHHVAMGFVVGLYDDTTCPEVYPYETCLEAGGGAQNFLIQNNLMDDISGDTWGYGESSYLFLMTAFTIPGVTRPFTPEVVIDHNTFVSGGANINSCDLYYSLVGGAQYPWPPTEPATSVQVSYNIFPFATCRDGATGPTAILPGTQFNHNSMAISFNLQSLWDDIFPGQGNLANSIVNPDGRGANLSYLSGIEAMVKSGSVCATDVSSQVSVSRGGQSSSNGTNAYTETLTLTNIGASTLSPLSVGILGLSNSVTLNSATGTTVCGSSPGAPYQNAPSSAVTLAPGQSVSLNLTMSSSVSQTIGFNTQVLAGPGLR
jgi:hypothetical protein